MKRAWKETRLPDGSGGPWLEYALPQFDFVLCDGPDGRYQVMFCVGCSEVPCGPPRKRRETALKDMREWLRQARQDFVQLGRAKLPVQDFPLSKDLGHARKVDKRK